MAKSKRDLFDDSTMTFGEHLEALRTHLWKALIGLVIAVIVMLYYSDHVLAVIRYPIDQALDKYGVRGETAKTQLEQLEQDDKGFWDYVKGLWSAEPVKPSHQKQPEALPTLPPDQVRLEIRADDLARTLYQLDSERYPYTPPETPNDKKLSLIVSAPEFAQLQKTIDTLVQPVTLTVQEAFSIYLKVAIVSGLVLASPWVFYQMWLFVAAGLYPHERKYVHIFLPVSLGLFVGGALFCFFVVFKYVLDFLLGFNAWLGIRPEIRLSEWISFALTLPLMFGVSFQLPLVMLFLEKIGIFTAQNYREKRRMAYLVISILAMVLTPSEPSSMIAMMVPLIILYEVGIWMCGLSLGSKSPFEAGTT